MKEKVIVLDFFSIMIIIIKQKTKKKTIKTNKQTII